MSLILTWTFLLNSELILATVNLIFQHPANWNSVWLIVHTLLFFFLFHSNWFSPDSQIEWGIGRCHLFLTFFFAPPTRSSLTALYIKNSCSKLISQVSSLLVSWLPRSHSVLQYVYTNDGTPCFVFRKLRHIIDDCEGQICAWCNGDE